MQNIYELLMGSWLPEVAWKTQFCIRGTWGGVGDAPQGLVRVRCGPGAHAQGLEKSLWLILWHIWELS